MKKWTLALVILFPIALFMMSPTRVASPPGPAGVLFGAHIDWSTDTPLRYIERSGLRPAQFGAFIRYPLDPLAEPSLLDQAREIAAVHANMFLTLEPIGGLSSLDASAANDLVDRLRKINKLGVTVYVRFGQEMNGSWYVWGEKPAAYRSAFQLVAAVVHARAPGNPMVWSPNYGGGYPFFGGPSVPSRGSADFSAIDTNHDGQLSTADDPYSPYYPGDRYVDWVGLTLYHFGRVYPWGENETPDAGKFVDQMLGTYNGPEGDERSLPDFYDTYAVGHRKPMALSETGSLYNVSRQDGASEAATKCGWMDQVFDPAVSGTRFKFLKMENWFEFAKFERERYGLVDWRATSNPTVLSCLRRRVGTSRFLFAPE